MAEKDQQTSGSTVTSQTAKKATAPRQRSAAKKSSGTTLEVGAEASKDVYLKMQGGYGEDFLVPGQPDDGQPGVLLVQKGDVITNGAVSRMQRAKDNAERLKG